MHNTRIRRYTADTDTVSLHVQPGTYHFALAGGAAGTRTCATTAAGGSALSLACADSTKVITGVEFASFGLPSGSCGSFATSDTCHAGAAVAVVERACMGASACTVAFDATSMFNGFSATCAGMASSLRAAVQVTCSARV